MCLTIFSPHSSTLFWWLNDLFSFIFSLASLFLSYPILYFNVSFPLFYEKFPFLCTFISVSRQFFFSNFIPKLFPPFSVKTAPNLPVSLSRLFLLFVFTAQLFSFASLLWLSVNPGSLGTLSQFRFVLLLESPLFSALAFHFVVLLYS